MVGLPHLRRHLSRRIIGGASCAFAGAALSVGVAAATLSSQPSEASSQPTFASRVEGVRVDVLVTDRSRRPVRGLAPVDFEVRDNDVLQTVDLVSFGDIPLSVGLVFDLSESVAGVGLERLKVASAALAEALEPRDEVGLVSFNRVVSLPCPLAVDPGCILKFITSAHPRGDTALIDGVFAGMMVAESEIGRTLLVVFTDGMDTASWLPADRVIEAARRSDVVVYAVATRDSRPAFLKELVDLTGGQLFEVNRDYDLASIFRNILGEFRHRYLLTFTPTDSTTGWHSLKVRVKRSGVSVKARPGYLAASRQ